MAYSADFGVTPYYPIRVAAYGAVELVSLLTTNLYLGLMPNTAAGAFAVQANATQTLAVYATISDVAVNVVTNTSASDRVCKVMKNGGPTVLTVTIPAGQTGTFRSNESAIEYAPGDTVSLQLPGIGAAEVLTLDAAAAAWQFTVS